MKTEISEIRKKTVRRFGCKRIKEYIFMISRSIHREKKEQVQKECKKKKAIITMKIIHTAIRNKSNC